MQAAPTPDRNVKSCEAQVSLAKASAPAIRHSQQRPTQHPPELPDCLFRGSAGWGPRRQPILLRRQQICSRRPFVPGCQHATSPVFSHCSGVCVPRAVVTLGRCLPDPHTREQEKASSGVRSGALGTTPCPAVTRTGTTRAVAAPAPAQGWTCARAGLAGGRGKPYCMSARGSNAAEAPLTTCTPRAPLHWGVSFLRQSQLATLPTSTPQSLWHRLQQPERSLGRESSFWKTPSMCTGLRTANGICQGTNRFCHTTRFNQRKPWQHLFSTNL